MLDVFLLLFFVIHIHHITYILAPPQAEITSRVFLDIAMNHQPLGRIVIGLHGTVVPKTVKNFETLCQGTQRAGNTVLSYEQSTFHRVIPNFMIQVKKEINNSVASQRTKQRRNICYSSRWFITIFSPSQSAPL